MEISNDKIFLLQKTFTEIREEMNKKELLNKREVITKHNLKVLKEFLDKVLRDKGIDQTITKYKMVHEKYVLENEIGRGEEL